MEQRIAEGRRAGFSPLPDRRLPVFPASVGAGGSGRFAKVDHSTS